MYDWSEEHYNLCLCHGVTTSLILSNRWSQVVAMTTSWLSGPSGLIITWRGESTCPRSSTVWVLTARVGDSWSRYVPCSEKHHGSSATAVTDHNWLSLFQIVVIQCLCYSHISCLWLYCTPEFLALKTNDDFEAELSVSQMKRSTSAVENQQIFPLIIGNH